MSIERACWFVDLKRTMEGKARSAVDVMRLWEVAERGIDGVGLELAEGGVVSTEFKEDLRQEGQSCCSYEREERT